MSSLRRSWILLAWAASLATAQENHQPNDLSWVDQRATEWAPRPSERKFDQIAWVTEARAAVELGKKHNRPIFIFTHDGRMARGRC
jgi:hypothetical protein